MNSDFLPRPEKRHTPQTHHTRPATTSGQAAHFRTPDQVAADDDREAAGATNHTRMHPGGGFSSHHGPVKKSLKERLKNLSKKQWVSIGVVAVLLLGGLGTGVYAVWLHDSPKPVAKEQRIERTKPQPAPQPTPITSTLTGLPISDATINDRPVTAIMIENSVYARPQSGLSDAGVVFEAVAEGGITRFLTLWQDTDATNIGPVRSVRPYYLQWLQGFDAAVAHAGGSGDALRLIKEWNVKDLDQFHNSSAYWRISSRYAPHNLYTSTEKLHTLESSKGIGKANYNGFARKAEAPSNAPNARTIDFNISGATYNSHYDYDAPSNSYLRSEGGAAHTDQNTGKQIAAKVVIGLVMNQGSNGIYTTYDTIGSGKAYIFQDGIATTGTWHKTGNGSNFTFTDDAGNELKLDAGKTWITVVGSTSRVSYKP